MRGFDEATRGAAGDETARRRRELDGGDGIPVNNSKFQNFIL